MDNSSEIFPTNGTDSLDGLFYDTWDSLLSLGLNIIVILLGFPINSYVIWLIVTGTGNGLAAEFFNLNLSVCEILSLGRVLLFLLPSSEIILNMVFFLEGLTFTGRAQFLCLMCVERYLAVVHPVTFLKYKLLRYRVICCVIVWVVSAVFGGVNIVNWNSPYINLHYTLILAQLLLFLSIQLFCLVAVLRVLKQLGPGERTREKEENLMKRRAFNIILITTMTMLISFVFYMIVVILLEYFITLASLDHVGYDCIIMAGWVQPLFFFYRVGKLPFIRA